MLKKIFIVTILGLTSLAMLASPLKANAVTAADWQAGRIIDDGIFTSKDAMSVAGIQDFLNQKVGTTQANGTPGVCDTNGTKTSELGGGTRAQYGAAHGNPTPFTCLKDYYEVPKLSPGPGAPASNYGGQAIPSGAKSAAQIIWDAAQANNISPKVLLVTLQKESVGPLVTDDWPFHSQYLYAMGAHCPDSGPGGSANCDTNYAGFSLQINESAALFRWYLDNMTQPWWSYKKLGNNSILYNPSTSCGSSNVNITTSATAALYTYTPYQPNQAALNNMYGLGDGCSAYGNRNFWRMYNDWFGSTLGPSYAWQPVGITYSTGTNVFATNETGTVTLTVKNTSSVPWYNYGTYPVRLGTWGPDRNSALSSPGWFSPTRPSNMVENQVQPGGLATFIFPITAHSTGTYVEPMNLVVENSQWMPDEGFSPTIVIKPPYQWQINNVTYGDGTGLMTPGTGQLVTVSALNTGADTWSKSSGPPIRLGTWQPGQSSKLIPPTGATPKDWLSSIRTSDMNESSVAPGQVGNFQFYVYPHGSGPSYERFNLVAEGQTWFTDAGLTTYIAGGTYSWKPLWSAYSTGGDANLSPGTTLTVTVKAQNTGDIAWTNTSTPNNPWPVRLATTSPMNRGTLFYDPSWISDTRPATLQENIVQPGQQGTFTFTARIPANAPPGPRYEHFSLVAEGMTWFNDPGFYLYVNVK